MEKRIVIAAPDPIAVVRYGGLTFDAWRWIGTLALIAVAAALPFTLSKYHVFELTMVMIYAIAVLGLNILTGYNGQISLGHGGFFAAGAYTAAILMHRYGVPYWATLPPAALTGFALGVLFGLPALRFEGPYLALVTLAMALAAAGYQVFGINPLQTARYRDRHGVSGARSGDAHALAGDGIKVKSEDGKDVSLNFSIAGEELGQLIAGKVSEAARNCRIVDNSDGGKK